MRCDETTVFYGAIPLNENQQIQGLQMELNLEDSSSHHHEQRATCCEMYES